MSENQEQEQSGRTEQTNVSWKPGKKAQYQAAYEAWQATAPKGSGAGDFIIHLIAHQAKAQRSDEINSRLEKLGIRELIDMHKRRFEADDAMIEQIAQIVQDARAKAESEVEAHLRALETGAAAARDRIEDLESQLEAAKSEIKETQERFLETHGQKTQLQEQLKKAHADHGKEVEAMMARIQESQENLNMATSRMEEAEKVAREQAARLEEAQKEALEARKAEMESTLEAERLKTELVAQNQQHEIEQTKLKDQVQALFTSLQAEKDRNAEAEQAKAKLQETMTELMAKIQQSEIDHARLKDQAQSLTDSLNAVKGKNLEVEQVKGKLQEAMIKIASLEAKNAGQQEMIQTLRQTVATLAGHKNEQHDGK